MSYYDKVEEHFGHYEIALMEDEINDSVQPAFCNNCGYITDAEPDAEYPCNDCQGGVVKSLTNIMLF